jgi:predicted ATP-dependent protease
MGRQPLQRRRVAALRPSDVERLIEFGVRQAGDRDKVLASYAAIGDLVREAAFWARKEDRQLVSARHVEKALESRVFRSNRIEEDIRELIANGTILDDITGKKVGQVNGLSVSEIGGYAFGRPSRVTASVGMGQAGIINIERESYLSGSIHDKGMLILAGYLRNRFGQNQPPWRCRRASASSNLTLVSKATVPRLLSFMHCSLASRIFLYASTSP